MLKDVPYPSLPSLATISPILSTPKSSSSMGCECHVSYLSLSLPSNNTVRLPPLSTMLANLHQNRRSSIQSPSFAHFSPAMDPRPYPSASVAKDLLDHRSLSRILNLNTQKPNDDFQALIAKRGICNRKKCSRLCKQNSLYCKWHVDSRICRMPGCEKSSKSGGYCISHGGGRRCQYPGGCKKSAKQGELCIAHGGGIRCSIPNCPKASVARGLCVAHGGGRKCKVEGCERNSVALYLCRIHGGRRRPVTKIVST